MAQTRGTSDETNDQHKSTEHRDERPQADAVTSDHPALSLQQTAGNRAVQRLVGGHTGAHPATIQRHISPGTSALGTMTHASLMTTSADLSVDAMALQDATASIQQTANQVLQDSTQVLILQVTAENYPVTQPTGGTMPETLAPGGQTTTD